MKTKNNIKSGWEDKLFIIITRLLLLLFLLIVAYPVYFVVIASFTEPVYVNSGEMLLFPKGFTTIGYSQVFRDMRIWQSYANTILYAACGTFFGLAVSVPAGYALSAVRLPGRNILMALLVFTMYFSGGLVPLYMTVSSLGLISTKTILIIFVAVNTYNLIIARTFIETSSP